MVAPVTGNDVGLLRAEIKQGLREVILCKDQDGKIGLRLKSVDNVSILKWCFCRQVVELVIILLINSEIIVQFYCGVANGAYIFRLQYSVNY